MTITVITLLKRKAGMSREAFIEYYETKHAKIGEQVLGGFATRYVRRFITPLDATEQDIDYDVVMEIDFPDEAVRDAFFKSVSDAETAIMIADDEAQLFAPGRIRAFSVVKEARSDLGA